MQDAAVALSEDQSRRKGKKRQQPGLVPGMQLAMLGAGEQTGEAAQALTAVRESLSPTVWAAGRLSEQQLQHRRAQHKHAQWVRSEVQHHVQLWHALLPVLAVCKQQLNWLGPLQLMQLAAGLGKLVQSSRTLLELQQHAAGSAAAGGAAAITAGEASGTPIAASTVVADGPHAPGGVSTALTRQPGATDAAAASRTAQGAGQQVLLASSASQGLANAEGAGAGEHVQELGSVLSGPALRGLLQQHLRRVEAVLPLLVVQHRLQIAAAYSQLGVQLPRSMAAVFDRDAAQHK